MIGARIALKEIYSTVFCNFQGQIFLEVLTEIDLDKFYCYFQTFHVASDEFPLISLIFT